MPNPIVHFEIGCRDREKSTSFYQQLFDWEMTPGEISTDIRTDAESASSAQSTTSLDRIEERR